MHRTLIDKLWYDAHPLRWLLYPFSKIYQFVCFFRRIYFLRFKQKSFQVPIIVVGNLTVGGVGKTPLVIALAQQFCDKGLRVGIVSRGYGSRIRRFPHEVSLMDGAVDVGDEPLLIAKKTNCPVVIAPKRVDAVRYLLKRHQSQIIISDDGLQHYALARTIEIAVIDGVRGLGNGLCLPAGPLREGPKRLNSVDYIVVNGGEWPNAHQMNYFPGPFIQIKGGRAVEPSQLEQPVAAVAGIGNPQSFFTSLENLKVQFKPYPFPDHHCFKKDELQLMEKTIVMTEKDAIKCLPFANEAMYFLPINAILSEAFWHDFWSHKQLNGFLT